MEDSLNKRFYFKGEVLMMIEEIQSKYDETLREQRGKIAELLEENKQLSLRLSALTDKEDSIAKALVAAVEKGREIEREAALTRDNELRQLRLYREELKRILSESDVKDEKLKSLAEEIDKNTESETDGGTTLEAAAVARAEEMRSREVAAAFSPKEKIHSYINAQSGFDMNEVLNPPKDLNLADLCRSLGLMDD